MSTARLVAPITSAAIFCHMKQANERSDVIDPEIRAKESIALRALWDAYQADKAAMPLSQAAFGAQYGIGVQGMVWQYLNNQRPLHLPVAIAFAKGLGVPIRSFSPRLADLAATAVQLNQEPGTDEAARAFAARYAAMPFEQRRKLEEVFRLVTGTRLSDEQVEEKMPITRARSKPAQGEN